MGIARRKKFDGEFFALRHLPEVRQIRANDWHSVSACQVSNAAGSGGRRIWHDGDGSFLKQIGQRVFWNIAAKFDSRIAYALLLDGLRVARGLGMVAPGNHELRVGQLCSDQVEGLEHQLKAFVSSPLAESQNPMHRGTAAGEIGKFRPAREDAMRTHVNVVASILVVQNLAIAWHEHRNRI